MVLRAFEKLLEKSEIKQRNQLQFQIRSFERVIQRLFVFFRRKHKHKQIKISDGRSFSLQHKKQPNENETIKKISEIIRQGARTFLKREYRVLACFAGICALLILSFLPKPIWEGGMTQNVVMAISYLAGTCISAIAGKIGIEVATVANTKAAEAAKKGINYAIFNNDICICIFTNSFIVIFSYKKRIS